MLSVIILLALPVPADALEHADSRAAAIAKERPAGAPPVAALLSRAFATQLGLENPYAAATFSFEHATRDDAKLTVNDWDVQFGNGGDLLSVNMVVDDRSRIFDLGVADFATAPAPDAPLVSGGDKPVDARAGHVYVVHTVDRDTDLWTRFRILELEKGRWIVFEWERVEPSFALRRLERTALPDLASVPVRLEVKSHSAGGNPYGVFFDGTCTASVKSVSRTPLDAAVRDDPADESAAFAEGAGFVPEGHVFVVDSIEWRARLENGATGPLEFEVWAGPYRVASREVRGADRAILHAIDRGVLPDRSPTSASGRFTGPVAIRPGEETRVSAHARNGTRCDAAIAGRLVPDSTPLSFPASLTKRDAGPANDLLRRIDAGEADGRARDASAGKFEAFLEDVHRFRPAKGEAKESEAKRPR